MLQRPGRSMAWACLTCTAIMGQHLWCPSGSGPLLMTRMTISIDWLKQLNLTVIRQQLSLQLRVEKENKSGRLYTYTKMENLS